MRHAHSLDPSPSIKDHERPISDQGRKDAFSVAQQLQDCGWLPDVIICSNAKRTKQTMEAMVEVITELGHVDAHFLGSLYTVAALDGQTRSKLEECVGDVVDDITVQCVMCMGHNKGWEEAASSFTGTDVRLHSATAALLEKDGNTWTQAFETQGSWRLVDLLQPVQR